MNCVDISELGGMLRRTDNEYQATGDGLMVDTVDTTNASEKPEVFRFGISTLWALTILISLVAAYMHPHGTQGFLSGCITITAAIVIGLAAGALLGDRLQRVYWACVACAMIQVLTINVHLLHPTGITAWPIIAALPAAIVSGRLGQAMWSGHITMRMLVSALVATGAYVCYVLIIQEDFDVMMPELVCAPIGGGLLAVMIAVSQWVEANRKVSQIVIAFALVTASIGVALISRLFGY